MKRLTFENIFRFIDLHSGRTIPRQSAMQHMLSGMQHASVLLSPGLWAAGYPKADQVFQRSQSTLMPAGALEPLPHARDITSTLHAAIAQASGHPDGLAETLGASSCDPTPAKLAGSESIKQSAPGCAAQVDMDGGSDTGSLLLGVSSSEASQASETRPPLDLESSMARALNAACFGGKERRRQVLYSTCEGIQRAIVRRILDGENWGLEQRWGLRPGTVASFRKRPDMFKVTAFASHATAPNSPGS